MLRLKPTPFFRRPLNPLSTDVSAHFLSRTYTVACQGENIVLCKSKSCVMITPVFTYRERELLQMK
jgi:hypothetical protein